MSENNREPEVLEAEVPAVEPLDGLARITLEELAMTIFVKSGTLQNASSTQDQGWLSVWRKEVHSHIVRLPNKRQKKSKNNNDKSAVATLKKDD